MSKILLNQKYNVKLNQNKTPIKKVVLKTNINYYEKTNKYLNPVLLEKNIENIKYYNNILILRTDISHQSLLRELT